MITSILVLLLQVPLPPTRITPKPQPSPAGNALVIVLDDVAYDDLMPLKEDGWLPHIQMLAAAGMTFHNAYANATCSPTRQSINLGRWRRVDLGLPCDPAADSVPVAERLLSELVPGPAGLFGKWHIGGNPTGGPWQELYVQHGYATWVGTPVNLRNCGSTGYTNWTRIDDGFESHSTDYQPIEIMNAAASWMNANKKVAGKLIDYRPALAHGPFHIPPPSLRPQGYTVGFGTRDKFEAMVVASDMTLGPLLANIDLAKDLVIVIGDNGTPEQVAPDPGRAKTTTFERGIHVPLFVAGRGVPVGESDALVHAVDVYATVAEFFGVTPPPNDGISLLNTAGHDIIICTSDTDVIARAGTVKQRRVLATGVETMYDLSTSPTEQISVLGQPAYASIEVKLRFAIDDYLMRDE